MTCLMSAFRALQTLSYDMSLALSYSAQVTGRHLKVEWFDLDQNLQASSRHFPDVVAIIIIITFIIFPRVKGVTDPP
jgi:hypothetical protein